VGVLPDWMIRESGAITPLEEGVKREGKISYGLSSYGYDIRAGYKFKVFTNVWGAEVDPKNFDPKAFVEVDLTRHDVRMQCTGIGIKSPVCINCGAPTHGLPDTSLSPCGVPCDFVRIPPNSFALAETVEVIEVPRNTLALVIGKSTYARCGLVLNCTPLEPEWRGKVTLEISNTTPLPARVYAGEGIGQVLFFESAGATLALYKTVVDMLSTERSKHTLLKLLQEAQCSCDTSYEDKRGKYQDQVGLTNPKVD